ncbi:MAG: lysine--tRNA ligase [Leptospirales bacterium]|jgi:lysyl-tRNA synthetase class 2
MSESRQSKKTPGADGAGAKSGGATDAADTSDLFENRLRKLEALQAANQDPFQQDFHPEHQAGDLVARDQAGFSEEQTYRLAGRVRSKRLMGKAAFLDLEDFSGRLQLYGNKKELGESFDLLTGLDLGDIIGVTGFLFATKTGQTTLHLRSLTLLSKSLRPLPVVKEDSEGNVFDAFADREQRYRMRYVDLIVNPQVRETFVMRSRIVSEIRNTLIARGFLEVETPMLQPIPGGASARPFITHHNTLDMELYLRIAPELYLKRLIVGGFPKVFEVNRNFRNEGISIKHNPEFTMLELYEAYGNMQTMLDLCEELIAGTAQKILGTYKIPYGEHAQIDLTPPWERLSYLDAIEKFSGVKIKSDMALEDAREAAAGAGLASDLLSECANIWKVAEALFDEKVEAQLIQPVFITDFPLALSPLAKAYPDRPDITQRFEPYIVGREIGNAFSELNDPVDQKRRFEDQVREREAGEGDGGYMDHDYIRALEYGMPPTGGMGIGIDRLVMLLTNSASIRDTILFPQLRRES